MFDLPRADQFTQGTVFSCAYAEDYPTRSVYGLVITARCDAAQNKAPIYNFVPVLKLEDWILHDGAAIALNRVALDHFNTKKNIVANFGLSDSLLSTKSTTEILEGHLIPRVALEQRLAAKVRQFRDCSDAIDQINLALSSRNEGDIKLLLKASSKHVDTMIRELASNKLLGHYLLRKMPRVYDDDGTDHIALLREIHHIPNTLTKRITRGISQADWTAAPIDGVRCPRFCQEDDYCIPVARLKSPWIEHLMQSLTLLFARVGVEDIDASSVRKSLKSLGLE